MTLSIRWDSSDTVLLSGGPGERYVHWPLEISASSATAVTIAVQLFDASNTPIVGQVYSGVPVRTTFGKFNPAVLVPDENFTTEQTWTLKATIYTETLNETPKQISKTMSNRQTGGGSSKSLMLVVGGVLLLFAFGGKKLLK